MKACKPLLLMTLPAMLGMLAACDQREAEPAASGALPNVTGRPLGPQPGPNRPMPSVSNPFEMERNVLTEGRRLFVWYNCYGCPSGRAGGGMGPSLRDAAWMYGGKDQDIFNSIAEGRPHGVPAWGSALPQEQIWKLTAYIKSIGTAGVMPHTRARLRAWIVNAQSFKPGARMPALDQFDGETLNALAAYLQSLE